MIYVIVDILFFYEYVVKYKVKYVFDLRVFGYIKNYFEISVIELEFDVIMFM